MYTRCGHPVTSPDRLSLTSDVARWRALGLELAFDPAVPPAALTPAGRAQLADELAHLDAALVVRHYPRDPAGKLPLGEVVLLAAIEVSPPLRLPKQLWLLAASPTKRSAAQVITLALLPEFGRNAAHRWDTARWLWDRRGASAPELVRWGTTKLAVGELAREAAAPPDPGTLARTASPDERVAHAIRLVRVGRWREALATCGVTHALDELPYRRANHGVPVSHAAWDDALEANLRAIAPWRLEAALAEWRPRSKTGLRLFHLPGQTVAMKWGIALRREAGAPHLAVERSGSNERLRLLAWQAPPDLALALGGAAGGSVAPAAAVTTSDTREDDLLAHLAATPLDEDALRVYGDLLAERGSARAQLVVPAVRKRSEASVIKKHARAWLGSLGPLVDLHSIVFARGLLQHVTLGSAMTPFDAWAGALTPRARHELAHVTHLGLAAEFPPDLARELLATSPPRLARLTLGSPLLLPAVTRAVDELEVHVATPPELVAHWPALVRAHARVLRIGCPRNYVGQLANVLVPHVAELVAPIDELHVVSGLESRLVGRRAIRESTAARRRP